MKTLLLLWLLVAASLGKAQSTNPASDTVSTATHALTYASTVPIAGATTTELYLRARLWLLDAHGIGRYKWAGDKSAGLIDVKGFYTLPLTSFSQVWLHYTLRLRVQNGQYKYEITDLYFRKPSPLSGTIENIPAETLASSTPLPKRSAERRYKAELDKQLPLLIANLTTGMQRPTAL